MDLPIPRRGFFNSEVLAGLVMGAVALTEALALFANGAYFQGAMTACVVTLWVLAVAAVFQSSGTQLLTGRALVPTIALAAFWLWTGASILWSISPDLTWNEFNRTGGYLAAFLIGVLVAGHKRIRLLILALLLVAATAAAFYSLGPKAAPTIVDNLNDMSRIAIPIGYANGEGLLAALAFPLALYLSTRKGANVCLRAFSILAAPLLLISLFFTLSRGALLALGMGLLVYLALSPLRQRGFYTTMMVAAPMTLLAWWSSLQPGLMSNDAPMDQRISAAHGFILYLAVALAAILIVFLLFLFLGRKISLSAGLIRASGGVLMTALVAGAVIALGLFILSKPSFPGWVDQEYATLTSSKYAGSGAERLFSVGSAVRFELWGEALSNWRTHPWTGSGGQSFSLVHLALRPAGIPYLKQPHSLPFRLLTELGLVGFILLTAFAGSALTLGALVLAGVRDRAEKGLAAALIVLSAIYLVHTSLDWDWNIFALTMPFFLVCGVMTGWSASLKSRRAHRHNGTR